MKIRFNNYDIVCGVTELQKLIGQRVNQVYDIDNKTYLIRFQSTDSKCVLLLESGIRFHTTQFEWPKNVAPSGFSMKLRKHIKNKRLESFQQLGVDRIVSFQFGTGEACYYVILELYDRGNIILADHEYTILNILRPHTQDEKIRFAVREKYPIDKVKTSSSNCHTEDNIKMILETANSGDNLRKILTPILDCGPSVVDHVLLKFGLSDCVIIIQGKQQIEETATNSSKKEHQNKTKNKQKKKENKNSRLFDMEKDFDQLMKAIRETEYMMVDAKNSTSKGFVIQKQEIKPSENDDNSDKYFYQNVEYHPYLFSQHKDQPHKEFDTFMAAVDEFYSTLESQKIDMKTMQQERDALKKLSNVKKDHTKRLEELNKVQEEDKQKAELISRNQQIVDNAILAVRSAVANQLSWPEIHELVKAAQSNNDPVAKIIKQLKLEINHIALYLTDPYVNDDVEDLEHSENEDKMPSMVVDVDLALSAFANARKYYDRKRSAAKKEQRTIDASQKALKSAEKKTQQTLKDVRTISTISKIRKVYWFEKFYWFISSENYLVIGGRDSRQNEMIVKRYMRPTDIYVHAEIQGASSVVIKNPTGGEIPPKTLLEAGTMAICYSVAWDAKVVTSAYWVKSDQVSKTAPSGEYLGTGSFMIRGKKNFLPPCHLIMGLGLLYKLEDSSVERHKGERRVKTANEQNIVENNQFQIENKNLESIQEEEIELIDSDKEDGTKSETEKIIEEDEEEPNTVENETETDNKISEFPDTQIKIEHDTGKIEILRRDPEEGSQEIINENNSTEKIPSADDFVEQQSFIIPIQTVSKKQQKNNSKKKKNSLEKSNHHQHTKYNVVESSQNDKSQKDGDKKTQQLKRGQKGKLKKIKEKYKDQDEEERELRMQILKSAGVDKTKEDSKNLETIKLENPNRKQQQPKNIKNEQQIDDTDDTVVNIDLDMLDSLTGCPVNEDELLFAVPVLAPYQSLQNYKFKVKLTPGTGKRGKAAKTALMIFAKDKSCTSREKDLMKGIKEDSLVRNIPGKVKISAPQLQKITRK